MSKNAESLSIPIPDSVIRFPPLHQCGSSVVILRVDPMWSGCFQTRCCCFISGFKQRVEQAKASQISLQRQKNGHSWTRRPRAGLKHSLYQHGRNSINIIDQRSGLDNLSHEYTEENGCCFDLLASTPPPLPPEFYIDKSSLDVTELWKP